MPPLQGFSDNVFISRDDFENAALALLEALCKYQSPGYARIRIPIATGTHFDEIAAQLEGYARSLWAVASLVAGNPSNPRIQRLASCFANGLANGTDPSHKEYWKPVVYRDQRMVEMEIISFALLAAPNEFYHSQTEQAKSNIVAWLDSLNGKDFPTTNWLWFRVFTNLALVKTCGIPAAEKQASMFADLAVLDSFDIGQGWQADGTWSEEGRQADYYSGSFAIQFSRLLYSVYANDIDPGRCQKYLNHAQEYSQTFWLYFNENGAAIPFGRSLTYRFAMAGFWAAAAASSGISLPPPLDELGIIKGLLLRHLRWWSKNGDMFYVDGTLSIGFNYPNMYMAEDYNSPQSVYWALKTFCALLLPANHDFWMCKEKPLPPKPLCQAIPAPLQILCDSGRHHFLLSSGQFCPWPLKATEAKYGKFAYSSHFGFSVTTGSLLPQQAPDSALAMSRDGGYSWVTRWRSASPEIVTDLVSFRNSGHGTTVETSIPVLRSEWKPWHNSSSSIRTLLIPPTEKWQDWHIRIHRVSLGDEKGRIELVEGGFAIYGRSSEDGLPLQHFVLDNSSQIGDSEVTEFVQEDESSALISSPTGLSGVRNISHQLQTKHSHQIKPISVRGEILKPDANTNLMCQRTLIPTIRHVIENDIVLVTAVFAIAGEEGSGNASPMSESIAAWNDIPVVRMAGQARDDEKLDTCYFQIDMSSWN